MSICPFFFTIISMIQLGHGVVNYTKSRQNSIMISISYDARIANSNYPCPYGNTVLCAVI